MSRERGTFERIYERDIDLAMIQLFRTSPAFLAWFCRRLNLHEVELMDLWHSYVHDVRESDIELSVKSSSGDTIILIENKINAELLPNQAEDYHQRGREYTEGEWDHFEVCLIAPEAYVGNDQYVRRKFNHILSYEEILKGVEQSDIQGNQFLEELFQEAIAEGERGYVYVPDDEKTNFLRYYWQLARDRYPCLQPDKPESASGNSWFRINPPSLENAQLIHKMEKGHVDLQLSKDDYEFEELRRKLVTDDLCAVNEANRRSYFVRGTVPEIHEFGQPNDATEVMLEALGKAAELRDFYLDELVGDR